MLQTLTLIQPLADCRDKVLAGGKAVNLGLLLRARFTVPDGFCVTTDAYRYWRNTGAEEIPSDLADEILRAYRALGSPPVAVRSSATAEDLAEASMAGQYDTFLDVAGEYALLDRVRCCWASLDSPRTRAYLQQHNIELARVAMAVVVQRLVPADVAGVLFTANPQTGSKNEMLVEASWGLGEAVVSGLVQPDVLRIDTHTGRVTRATIADKQVQITPGAHGETSVHDDRRRVPCLKGPDVSALWTLGRQAAAHFGSPQDVEWAIHAGQLYLLQSRPITTLEDAEAYEQLLTSTRADLREQLDNGRGPWVAHNLGETLPHPTPLTWSVIHRFMSGDGGFGRMYRQAGFDPSPAVRRDGFLKLIAGKIYMDASLAPEMFFESFPFRYDVAELRRNPDAAQNPPTIPRGPLTARLKMAKRAAAASHTVRALSADYDHTLTKTLVPQFTAWVESEKRTVLTTLTTDQLIALWHTREQRVMDEFAPQSLLPSLIAAAALADLRTFLAECFWNEDPDHLTHLLSSAHPPDTTLQSNAALYQTAQSTTPSPKAANDAPSPGTPSAVGEGRGEGSSDREGSSRLPPALHEWLHDYGHRAPAEFDLATPRWRERPSDLLPHLARLRNGHNPADLHDRHVRESDAKLAQLRASLPTPEQRLLDQKVALARRYLPFRETGKHHLMLGYDLLRDLALEIGRRLDIGDDVFLLTLEEVFDALHIGFPPTHLITQRKTQRRAEARIPLPHVIDLDNLESLGAPPRPPNDNPESVILNAFPISPGVATAPARIVTDPTSAADLGDRYVLVCPSTDPSWTPLFTNAAGLILERGGTLSHGAVVAREMSIPAVVLQSACTLLQDGDRVTLDGRTGAVSRNPLTPSPKGANTLPPPTTPTPVGEGRGEGSSAPPAESLANSHPLPDPLDTQIPRDLIPPPPGRKERRAARLRNAFLLAWALYLAAAFLLPEDILYQPSLRALDLLLWPLVRFFGKPGTVAAIAVGLALLTMLGQRLLTDNARLRVAKRRAAVLTDQADHFPPDSPRAATFRRAAAPVEGRLVLASFVPLALLLGPMVLIFFWIPARLDVPNWNAPPGTPVTVTAMVKPSLIRNVTLDVPPPLTLANPAAQPVPDVARVLTRYRDEQRKPSDLSNLPWELREPAERYRDQQLADLAEYLKDVPPVAVTWDVVPPDGATGHWPVALRADNSKTLQAKLVLGDAHPPTPAEVTNTPADPLRSLKLTYRAASKSNPQFFAPLFHYDFGWLGLYLLAYLPAMFAARAALKVA